MLQKYAPFIGLCLLLAISSFYAGWSVNGNRWEAKHNELIAENLKAQAEANAAMRAQESMWHDKIYKVTQDAKKTQERLHSDSEQLIAAVDSLRSAYKVSTSKLQSANSTITELRRTNATTELVQRELLGYSLARVESLAAAFDRSRAEGLACVSAYNALR